MQEPFKPEFSAVRHVLTAPVIASRTHRYIGDGNFDFTGLERECATMSGGEALLVRIARDLWTAEKTVRLADIPERLDARNFARVIDALAIARGLSREGLAAEAEQGGELAA